MMTPRCVCGHLKSNHPETGNIGCTRCNCGIYEPDDGTDGIADDSCLGPGRLGSYALDDQ